MKNALYIIRYFPVLLLVIIAWPAAAQHRTIQYFRPDDKDGVNLFETTKNDSVPFKGLKVKVGGNFSQDFQALRAHNDADVIISNGNNVNQLVSLTNGFNLAMANLNIDVQLAEGVRLNLTTYLSTRHHEDTWVKGGYIQFDRLPFLKSEVIDNLMNYFTIKVGDFEVDYGDQHYRRTDGGNTIYNPFVENYIMDAFTTEIGGEIYYHSKGGLFALGGISNGALNPTVVAATKTDAATGKTNRYAPAFHGKIGYDRQLNQDLRLRITGSFYTDKSAASNTLYWGDRAGSHYFLVMETATANATDNAWSGRYNPSFSQQVNAFMVNPFLKYKGLELFGTYEMAHGRMITETDMRKATQMAADLVYRFPAGKENFWIAARYNTVTARPQTIDNNITISRAVGSVGWFLTRNVMLKAEYVDQKYHDFPSADIRSGGRFKGAMIEASVGF